MSSRTIRYTSMIESIIAQTNSGWEVLGQINNNQSCKVFK